MASPALSFEFFPPKTEDGRKSLQDTHRQLATLAPDFFSVTYGAGGSTRDGTRDVVLDIQKVSGNAAAHLSFGGNDDDQVRALLDTYREHGVKHIVALQGDADGGDTRHAEDLVRFIREHSGDNFKIHVAAYPETHPRAESPQSDLEFLRRKLDAGADDALTQFFYDIDAWRRFMDGCQKLGIRQPIRPGVMPIGDADGVRRFAERCGAKIPESLGRELDKRADDPEGLRAFADDFVAGLCRQLLEAGACGLHFYTLNRTQPTLEVWRRV